MSVDVQPQRVLSSVGVGRVIWLGRSVVCFSANTGFGLKPFNALYCHSRALIGPSDSRDGAEEWAEDDVE